MRVITVAAARVAEVRRRLRLTQKQLAEHLGVSRRTIVRAEQRGMEVPWWTNSDRRFGLYETWEALAKRADQLADREQLVERVNVTSPVSVTRRD